MSYDLTSADAELNVLGALPGNLEELVERYAGDVSDRHVVDEVLASLGDVPTDSLAAAQPSEPSERPAAEERNDPESGEISLPSPAARGSQSGEFGRDQSGAFEVPQLDDDGAANDPSGAMRDAMSSQLPGPTESAREAPDAGPEFPPASAAPDMEPVPTEDPTSEKPVEDFASEEDELVAALGAEPDPDAVDHTRERLIVRDREPEPSAEEPEVGFAESLAPEQDPADAEFDAMFSDLTRPTVPPGAGEQDGSLHLDAPGGAVHDTEPPSVLTLGDQDEDADTQIIDGSDPELAAALGESGALEDDDEIEELDLDSGDLVVEEESLDASPPEPPGPPGPQDKKGGIFGRLLGRKGKEK